jgi:hypothetical protein
MSKAYEEVCLSGFGQPGIGWIIKWPKNLSTFTVEVGDTFRNCATNPRQTDDGRTVGDRNQQALHDALQEFIDKNLDKKIK